jgi:hypothetical protein
LLLLLIGFCFRPSIVRADPSDSTPTIDVHIPSDPTASSSGSTSKADDRTEDASSVRVLDECLVAETCIDRFLWVLYQRTPKVDQIDIYERREVTVKRRGRTVTVIQAAAKPTDSDFSWKDPKAAAEVDKTLMDYVIGGMDRDFKSKLFNMLYAAERAGLSPGITSGFRDDYRQSIASGRKARRNMSYHGGSVHGGYGHGLAADVICIKGRHHSERLEASNALWKWIDAHAKQFGIGRPYLSFDPPHVAPIDGKEYARHRGGGHSRLASRFKARRQMMAAHAHRGVRRIRIARSSKA